MRGRRTALGQVLVAVLAAAALGACDVGPSTDLDPSPGPTLAAVDPVGGGDPPELTEAVAVELTTAVAVFGLGCRPRSPHQRCSADGRKTYTLKGEVRAATVTAAWMELGSGGGRWTLNVRLAAGDSRALSLVAARATAQGGLVVVLDAHSGDVLHAVAPHDVLGVRITRSDLLKQDANAIVGAFVTATTGR
jgi:hypothetical protein